MGVQLSELITARMINLDELSGKTLIVDAPMWLYQFISSIRARDGSLFTDANGRVTSHLIGLSTRVPNLLRRGIKLAFAFDGKVPELKMHELTKRHEIKAAAEEKYTAAAKKGDFEEMKKWAARTPRLSPEMIEDAKELLRAFGISIIQAASEAEAQAAHIVKKEQAWAIATNDYDGLLFGAPRVVRNLSILGKKKRVGKAAFETVKPELIILADTLNNLRIDQEQLIALAMCVGTDFNPGGIKGIGPKTALKMVREFGKDFDKLFKSVKWEQFFDFGWQEAFNLIKKMPVAEDYELKWRNPDKNKIVEILCEKHNFARERIIKMADELVKCTSQSQKGLGTWFK